MANEIAKNVPNFIPMGQAAGQRVKQDEPVELDGEGKPINPHIPQFIAKTPWYLDSGAKSSLKHQRLEEKDTAAPLKNEWYQRGRRAGPAATKYRKGACENCGAASHKTKDCLERPRKIGAKWTGQDIQADEVITTVETNWDSKRDRANGYDFDNHTAALQAKFDRIEAIRAERGITDSSANEVDESNPQSVADQTKSNSNSHMRIREDTAHYLLKDQGISKEGPQSAGTSLDKQDFTRGTNEAAQFEKLQAFAAAASQTKRADGEQGMDIHAQAAPSQAALLYRKAQEEKSARKNDILSKYGNATQALPQHMLESAEMQKEYDAQGKLLTPKVAIKSKYEEDVLRNAHTSVWGSWYDKETAKWGYKCCKSMMKNAYCTAS